MFRKTLDRLEEYFLVYILAISVLLIFIQVIMRYVFSNSLSWSEEVARYLFLWLSWVGASLAVREREHFRVEMLSNIIKGKARLYYEIFIILIWCTFCLFLAFHSWKNTMFLWELGQKTAALEIPMAFAYASVPVGCLLMSLRLIIELKDLFYSNFKEVN